MVLLHLLGPGVLVEAAGDTTWFVDSDSFSSFDEDEFDEFEIDDGWTGS